MNEQLFALKGLSLILVSLLFTTAIKADETHIPVGRFGESGTDHTMQCSGLFPDWISKNPPAIGSGSFQLSQEYYQGEPVFVGGQFERFEAPAVPDDRPWLAFDFRGSDDERMAYANALLQFAHDGMGDVDYEPNLAASKNWYHAPMMHTDSRTRREPIKGVTRERTLRAGEYEWNPDELRTYAIGFYDQLSSYTIGQVFGSADPLESNPAASEFIDGAFVFKPIFSEFKPEAIDADKDPLVGSPEWVIQDYDSPEDTITIRLTQMDIAVKDPRAVETGWVFATYAYHKSLIDTHSNPWQRLVLIGLQWGADGEDSPGGTQSVEQSWINPDLQDVWASHLGNGGRLNGPIDNPESSCMSCHSTGQVDPNISKADGGTKQEFSGVDFLPYSSCDIEEDWQWYRNLSEERTFGKINKDSCEFDESASDNYLSTDYSLQVRDGLFSALFFANQNPCRAVVELAPPPTDETEFSESENNAAFRTTNKTELNISILNETTESTIDMTDQSNTFTR